MLYKMTSGAGGESEGECGLSRFNWFILNLHEIHLNIFFSHFPILLCPPPKYLIITKGPLAILRFTVRLVFITAIARRYYVLNLIYHCGFVQAWWKIYADGGRTRVFKNRQKRIHVSRRSTMVCRSTRTFYGKVIGKTFK